MEAAYSFENIHPIRGRCAETFFYVPPQVVIGRFRLSVYFPPEVAFVDSRTSADAPPRVDRVLADGVHAWDWTGNQVTLRDPEPNLPSFILDYLWIQVSDLSSWETIIGQVSTAWAAVAGAPELGEIPAFVRPAVVDEQAVMRLIGYIQEEFRYLSIELDAGGWTPAEPLLVARRRYGDCKDLAWLATTVLRSWSVTARPMLVGTGLRSQVERFLPMAGLFNHAVIEVSIAGKLRWFDLTMRSQGGDFDTYSMGWYGCGLPVDLDAKGLVQQSGRRINGVYAVRETILLDTRKTEPSRVEIRVWAEGWQADNLRRNRLVQGVDEFAKNRLKLAQNRYHQATRLGVLEWRDDRLRNVCELTEAFEIKAMLSALSNDARASFDVPSHLPLQWFALPEAKSRRGPWDMPFPLEVRHQITVRAAGMKESTTTRRKWNEPEFVATIEEPRVDGIWTKTTRFTVLADHIEADRVSEYRRQLDKFFQACGWRLFLPWGKPWTREPKTFGILLSPDEGVQAYVSPADAAAFANATSEPPTISKDVTKTPWLSFNRHSWWFWFLALMIFSNVIRSCAETPH